MTQTMSVGEHFAPNSSVSIHPRVSDQAPADHGRHFKRVQVDKTGELSLSGLQPFGQYWLVGENYEGQTRTVAINVPGQLSAPHASPQGLEEETRLRAEAAMRVRQEHAHLQAAAPADQTPERDLVGVVPDHNFEKSKGEKVPQPHVKQADIPKGQPQRSATPLGQGTPADPEEWQPGVPQSAVKKGTPQRSDTELGEATPVDPGEQEPGVRQEDAKGPQRSDTETGTAAPIEKGSKVQIEQTRDDSQQVAAGATPTKAKAGTSKGKDVTGRIKDQSKKDQKDGQS